MSASMLAIALMSVAIGQSEPSKAEPSKSMPIDVGPGRVAWFDLTTTDIKKSEDFYGKLFDWHFNALKDTDLAVEIVSGDQAIGTIRVAEGAIASFNGVVYIQVPDIQAACKKAAELGGTVVPGFPFDLSNRTGAIGLVSDPVGHPFGMYSRTPISPATPASK